MKAFRHICKGRFGIVAVFLIVFAVGYFGGKGIGKLLLQSLLTGRDRLIALLYMPSVRYFETLKYLDSADELKRLTGYYSLLYNDRIDVGFLVKRYQLENEIFMKRNLVWIMGFAQDEHRIFDTFISLYEKADDKIKFEIIRTLKRKNPDLLQLFMKRMGIPPSTVNGL